MKASWKSPESFLLEVYKAAVKAASPETLLSKTNFSVSENSFLLGAGKASYEMASAFVKLQEPVSSKGCIIVPDDFLGMRTDSLMKNFLILKGSHPLPSGKSLSATRRFIKFIREQPPFEEIVFFLSGGASALLELPLKGLLLSQVRAATRLLLNQGAKIEELNCVRKHLSSVKGGRLALLMGSRRCKTLILSDVKGDRVDAIGSGPTCPDPTTYRDALLVLRKLEIGRKFLPEVYSFLEKGANGFYPETPKPGNPVFKHYSWEIVGNFKSALKGAREKAETSIERIIVEEKFLEGEACSLGKWFAEKGKKLKGPLLYIAGGEPTVKVRGKGKGGRCQETVLSFLVESAPSWDAYGSAPSGSPSGTYGSAPLRGRPLRGSAGSKEMYLLAAGTDGIDGQTDAAGAIASNKDFRKGAQRFLRENNSHEFFRQHGGLIKTGRTGTNVNDLFLLLILS